VTNPTEKTGKNKVSDPTEDTNENKETDTTENTGENIVTTPTEELAADKVIASTEDSEDVGTAPTGDTAEDKVTAPTKDTAEIKVTDQQQETSEGKVTPLTVETAEDEEKNPTENTEDKVTSLTKVPTEDEVTASTKDTAEDKEPTTHLEATTESSAEATGDLKGIGKTVTENVLSDTEKLFPADVEDARDGRIEGVADDSAVKAEEEVKNDTGATSIFGKIHDMLHGYPVSGNAENALGDAEQETAEKDASEEVLVTDHDVEDKGKETKEESAEVRHAAEDNTGTNLVSTEGAVEETEMEEVTESLTCSLL